MNIKPGYKTTEFIVAVLTIIGEVVASAANWLPARYAAIAAAVSAAAYALSRGMAKTPVIVAGPTTPAPASQPTTVAPPPAT